MDTLVYQDSILDADADEFQVLIQHAHGTDEKLIKN